MVVRLVNHVSYNCFLLYVNNLMAYDAGDRLYGLSVISYNKPLAIA